jgi:hypothetical protein
MMISKLKLHIILLIPFWMFFQIQVDVHENDFMKINHMVSVKHPGEEGVIDVILTEIQNKESLPIEYYMDVESVICLKEVCKVIPVRVFWNNLGIYQKYELKKNATLEKYEADLFEPQDYNKLHTVLSNIDSPFREVRLDEILTVVDEHAAEDVDAVSGATALELDEKDTVPGAALTCFTLWHWANGEVVSKIKKNTAETVSNEQLLDFLSIENSDYYEMALEQLAKRNVYEAKFIDTIIQGVTNDDKLLRVTFKYLETSPSEIYFSSVKKIFVNGNKLQKIAVAKSLQSTKYAISKKYLDSFGKDAQRLSSFQEVSAFLELMQSKNPSSTIIIEAIMPLLDGDFLIARRVYWFLSNQNLHLVQKETINNFYNKYKTKL